MPKNTSVTLGDHFHAFIHAQIEDGRYSNASEVIRAGLRLLEEHEARVAALARSRKAARPPESEEKRLD